jgi:hypothetical protein
MIQERGVETRREDIVAIGDKARTKGEVCREKRGV